MPSPGPGILPPSPRQPACRSGPGIARRPIRPLRMPWQPYVAACGTNTFSQTHNPNGFPQISSSRYCNLCWKPSPMRPKSMCRLLNTPSILCESPLQRTVLYLGEINDTQQAAWRKSLEVLNETTQRIEQICLFPEDRDIPPDVLKGLQAKLSELTLRHPRVFGDCWLACRLWDELHLGPFWRERLPEGKAQVPWFKVLELLTVRQLVAPGSKWHLHRHWFLASAMDQLLEEDFAVAAKNRLYECLDRIDRHRADLFTHLQARWKDLFGATYDLLLYDLTSTYFEGEMAQAPKAKHGYSRDKRPDCRQVVIAVVLSPEGFPLAYEIMPGNTSDKTTLQLFLQKIQAQYGQAKRI